MNAPVDEPAVSSQQHSHCALDDTLQDNPVDYYYTAQAPAMVFKLKPYVVEPPVCTFVYSCQSQLVNVLTFAQSLMVTPTVSLTQLQETIPFIQSIWLTTSLANIPLKSQALLEQKRPRPLLS